MNRAASLQDARKALKYEFGLLFAVLCNFASLREISSAIKFTPGRKDTKHRKGVHKVRPHRPQNLVPEGYVTLHLGQSTSTGRGADQAICDPPSDAPQRPQNFVPAG